jgi:hypothetical protein
LEFSVVDAADQAADGRSGGDLSGYDADTADRAEGVGLPALQLHVSADVRAPVADQVDPAPDPDESVVRQDHVHHQHRQEEHHARDSLLSEAVEAFAQLERGTLQDGSLKVCVCIVSVMTT